MKDGITITTTHFAHLCIVPINDKSREHLELSEEIDSHLVEILKSYPSKPSEPAGVQIDDNFRSHLLTEVGICGSNLEQVKAVANSLASWIEEHPKLELIT